MAAYLVIDVDLYTHNPSSKRVEADSPAHAYCLARGIDPHPNHLKMVNDYLTQTEEWLWGWSCEDEMFIISQV